MFIQASTRSTSIHSLTQSPNHPPTHSLKFVQFRFGSIVKVSIRMDRHLLRLQQYLRFSDSPTNNVEKGWQGGSDSRVNEMGARRSPAGVQRRAKPCPCSPCVFQFREDSFV